MHDQLPTSRALEAASRIAAAVSLCCAALAIDPVFAAASYDGQRWFQIEISIFSHEGPDRNFENWSPDRLSLAYPEKIGDFKNFFDLLIIEEFEERVLGITEEDLLAVANDEADEMLAAPADLAPDALFSNGLNTATVIDDAVNSVGPFPRPSAASYQFIDVAREPYLQLSPELSDFQQTNRALRNSSETRLLYHGLWRQPVLSQSRAQALYVEGGNIVDGRHELQGSLTIRFNEGQDRVVLDTNLWLLEFSDGGLIEDAWRNISFPASESAAAARASELNDDREGQSSVSRVFQLTQSRDMRSDEFHYIDHPAFGIVIMVNPYDLPVPGSSIEEQLEDQPAQP